MFRKNYEGPVITNTGAQYTEIGYSTEDNKILLHIHVMPGDGWVIYHLNYADGKLEVRHDTVSVERALEKAEAFVNLLREP